MVHWKTLLSTLSIVSLIGLGGCGKLTNADNQGNSSGAAKKQDPAAGYYDQFVSKLKPSTPADVKRLVAKTSFPLNGQAFPVTLELTIFDDHSFVSLYTEEQTGQSQEVDGNWQVSSGQLMLANLGQATGEQINGHPGLLLKMDRDIITPGLLGKYVEFGL